MIPPFAKIWEMVLNGSPKTRQKYPTGWGFPAPSTDGSQDTGSKGEGAVRGAHHSLRVNLSPIHPKAGRHLRGLSLLPKQISRPSTWNTANDSHSCYFKA